CGLHLVHGTEVRVEGSQFVLLATDRASYGSVASLITIGRRRGKKGSYALSLADLEKVNALVLWVPGDDRSMAPWLAERFAGRAGIAAGLAWGPDDPRKVK